ncbi:hypothetical protein DD607_28050 [Salmonella sp. 3DZ2-4SM]|nr:hypothetical protein DD607_28050 [Salmonella sp. 3DZ2-4SM]
MIYSGNRKMNKKMKSKKAIKCLLIIIQMTIQLMKKFIEDLKANLDFQYKWNMKSNQIKSTINMIMTQVNEKRNIMIVDFMMKAQLLFQRIEEDVEEIVMQIHMNLLRSQEVMTRM